MKDKYKTRKQLIEELNALRLENDSLKSAAAGKDSKRTGGNGKAGEELADMENRYHELMRHARDVIFYLSPRGSLISLNRAFERTTGWKIEEWIGKPFTGLLHPEDIPLAKERFSNLLKGNIFQAQEEIRIRRKTGGYTFVEFLASPQVKNDQIVGILGIARDISERKQAEEALRESERKARAIFDLSFGFIGLLSPEGTLLEVNNTALELLDIPMEDVIGKPFWETPWWSHSPEVQDQIRRAIRAAAKGEFVREETTHPSKDGTMHSIDFTLKPILDDKGRVSYLIPEGHDISERKMAEDELQLQLRFQELLMNIATTYINLPLEDFESMIPVSLGELGTFVGAERVQIFKYESGMQFASCTHEWCAENVSPQISNRQKIALASMPGWDQRAHRTGKPIFIPDAHLLPPGGLRDLFMSGGKRRLLAVPLMHDGECTGFVSFGWIEPHQTNTAIEQHLLTVFALMLVNIQQRKQTEEVLIRAKEKAEESNRLKTAFMNNISHEVRTPLNGILGFAELITKPGISEKEKEAYLEVINSSSDRLIDTITNYMDISLIVSGNMPVRKQRVDLPQFLNRVHTKFLAKFKTGELEFVKQIPPAGSSGDHILLCDALLLEKSLSHLVDNGIKFTSSGRITLGFRPKGNEYEIFVKDTGTGVDPEAREKIFDYFTQEEVSDTRRHEGSGLGLSITKGLVELMGGRMRMESSKGKGSTFILSFPAEPIVPADIEPADIPGGTGSAKKAVPVVLIAEDDESSLSFYKKILEEASFGYRIALNGAEAVDLCRKHPGISIVLMDIKMPEMDGLEATRKIKGLRKDLPVIGVSAYAMAGDREEAIDAGCDDYLTKPVDAASLLAVINKQLGKAGRTINPS